MYLRMETEAEDLDQSKFVSCGSFFPQPAQSKCYSIHVAAKEKQISREWREGRDKGKPSLFRFRLLGHGWFFYTCTTARVIMLELPRKSYPSTAQIVK